MVVTSDTDITEIDEALGHLVDVRTVARRCGDRDRDASLTDEIEHLLEQRFERDAQKNPALGAGAIQCSGPLSPRHPSPEIPAASTGRATPPEA